MKPAATSARPMLVIDSSAIVAVMRAEPQADALTDHIGAKAACARRIDP
jgi:uncharacterized protein with PIN domain